MKAAALCALLAAGLAAHGAPWRDGATAGAGRHFCTAPPAPDGQTRTVAPGHAPSSFAPHPRARSHSYGAPIPRPIVTRRAKGARRPLSAPPASSK